MLIGTIPQGHPGQKGWSCSTATATRCSSFKNVKKKRGKGEREKEVTSAYHEFLKIPLTNGQGPSLHFFKGLLETYFYFSKHMIQLSRLALKVLLVLAVFLSMTSLWLWGFLVDLSCALLTILKRTLLRELCVSWL